MPPPEVKIWVTWPGNDLQFLEVSNPKDSYRNLIAKANRVNFPKRADLSTFLSETSERFPLSFGLSSRVGECTNLKRDKFQ